MLRHTVKLTVKQEVILTYMCMGYRTKRIASLLGITSHAAHSRCRDIYNKLGAESRTHAVVLALKLGVFDQMYGFWGS